MRADPFGDRASRAGLGADGGFDDLGGLFGDLGLASRMVSMITPETAPISTRLLRSVSWRSRRLPVESTVTETMWFGSETVTRSVCIRSLIACMSAAS